VGKFSTRTENERNALSRGSDFSDPTRTGAERRGIPKEWRGAKSRSRQTTTKDDTKKVRSCEAAAWAGNQVKQVLVQEELD
jgi:hypothetical protein